MTQSRAGRGCEAAPRYAAPRYAAHAPIMEETPLSAPGNLPAAPSSSSPPRRASP